MQQLTSGETFGLMEAYASIYDSQETIEGQYLYEMPAPATPEQRERIRRQSDPAYDRSRFDRPRNANTTQTFGGGRSPVSTVRPQIGSLPTSARQVTQYPQGVSTGVGGGNAGASRPTPRPTSAPAPRPTPRPTSTPAARPSTPAARTSTPAARPTAPAAKVTPPAATPATPASRTPNPLLKDFPKAPSTAAPTGGVQLSARDQALKAGGPKAGARERVLNQDLDLFDIIKGHLLDEGYADTEQAAEAIMVNMSEDWRESIVEGAAGAFVPSKVDDFNNRRDMLKNRYGQDVSPRIPGPSGGGQFEKPSSNPAGVLRLAKTSSKSDTKTA
jgi:hypothetical protein